MLREPARNFAAGRGELAELLAQVPLKANRSHTFRASCTKWARPRMCG